LNDLFHPLTLLYCDLDRGRMNDCPVIGNSIKSPLSPRAVWDWCLFCAKITPHFCCFLANMNIQTVNRFSF
jgi:hypothetical protein